MKPRVVEYSPRQRRRMRELVAVHVVCAFIRHIARETEERRRVA